MIAAGVTWSCWTPLNFIILYDFLIYYMCVYVCVCVCVYLVFIHYSWHRAPKTLVKWKGNLLSHVWLIAIPWTLFHQVLCPWNSPGKNTGVGSHSLPQGIFPNQGSNPGLPHCRQILYHLSHRESQNSCNFLGFFIIFCYDICFCSQLPLCFLKEMGERRLRWESERLCWTRWEGGLK